MRSETYRQEGTADDLSTLRSQLEFCFGFHTNGGAMPKVLEPPMAPAGDSCNHGSR